MQRLSEIIRGLTCYTCGTFYDRTTRVNIGVNNYEILVKCDQCYQVDVVRIGRGEMFKAKELIRGDGDAD